LRAAKYRSPTPLLVEDRPRPEAVAVLQLGKLSAQQRVVQPLEVRGLVVGEWVARVEAPAVATRVRRRVEELRK